MFEQSGHSIICPYISVLVDPILDFDSKGEV